MKKVFNNKYFIDFILLYIPLFLIEIIFRLVSGYSLLDLSLLRISIGLLVITAIITCFLTLCNKIVTRIIQTIIITAASIYAVAQLGFFNFLGVYVSVQESSQMGAVTDYIKDFISSFKITYFLPLLALLLYFLPIIIFRKQLANIKKIKFSKTALTSFLLITMSSIMYYGTLTIKSFNDKYQTTTNTNLFLTVSNTTNSMTKFGSTGFIILDIRQKLFPVSIQESYVSLSLKKHENTNTEYEEIEGISDTKWQEIIAATDNKDYESLNEYFTSLERANKNEYTGLLKGKNVIFILLESTNDIIYEYPEYYPNFAKMVNNSFYFENNYSPRNSCATLNNEFSGMTGLYSVSKVCTGKEYLNNSYFQSVFNLFNKQNYTTFSAHDYTEAYYPRKKFHINLGSGEYFGVDKLGISYSDEYINWANDDEFMEKVLEILKIKKTPEKGIMAWLTTVSSHQPYGVSSIQGDRYLDMTKDTNLPEDVRRYMSKLKILDNSLGVLLDGLKEQGILEDTVIVMYGDHYPYGLSTDNLNEALPYDTAEDKNAEKVPMLIYNPLLEKTTIKEYTTYVNILPTVANLLDLNYDPRLMMGKDLLSSNYNSLVVFADGSWKNENAYYDAALNKVTYYNDTYIEEDAIAITQDVSTVLKVSNKVIESDYMNFIEKILSKNEKTYTPVIIDEKICDNVLSS